jgi:hypothetical protein
MSLDLTGVNKVKNSGVKFITSGSYDSFERQLSSFYLKRKPKNIVMQYSTCYDSTDDIIQHSIVIFYDTDEEIDIEFKLNEE